MKDTGFVRWEFTGDIKLAQAYTGHARKLLGFINTTNTQKLNDQQLHGSVGSVQIYVGITFGQKWARIYAPPGGGQYERSTCKGFIVDYDLDQHALCWNVEEAFWYKPDPEDFLLGLTGIAEDNQVEKLVNYTRSGRIKRCCLSYGGRRYYPPTGLYTRIYIDGRVLTSAPTPSGSAGLICGLTVYSGALIIIMQSVVDEKYVYDLFSTQFRLEYKDNQATWIKGSLECPDDMDEYYLVQRILFSETGNKGIAIVYDEVKESYPPEYKSRFLRVVVSGVTSAKITLTICDTRNNVRSYNSTVAYEFVSTEDPEVPEIVDLPYACFTPPLPVPIEGIYADAYSRDYTGNVTSTVDYASKQYFAADYDEEQEVFGYFGATEGSAFGTAAKGESASSLENRSFTWSTTTCYPGGSPPGYPFDYVSQILTEIAWTSSRYQNHSSSSSTSTKMHFGEIAITTYEGSGTWTYSSETTASGSDWVATTGGGMYLDSGEGPTTINATESVYIDTPLVQRYILDYDLRFGGTVLYLEHTTTATAAQINYGTPTFEASNSVELKLITGKAGGETTTLRSYDFATWTPTAINTTMFQGLPPSYVDLSLVETDIQEDPTNSLWVPWGITRPGIAQTSLFVCNLRTEKDIYNHQLISFRTAIRERAALGVPFNINYYTYLDQYAGNPITELSGYPEETWYPYIHVLGEGYLPPSLAIVKT